MAASGAPYDPTALAALAEAAGDLPIHMDGARLFNAEVALGKDAATLAAPATTVMTCLSKGLCAPVGSVLAGPAELEPAMRLERQRLGGAMRQAGVLAAAGLVGLQTMVERLAEDHDRARDLAESVAARWPDASYDPETVCTNIVAFEHPDPAGLLAHLRQEDVLADTIAPGVVRFVTHREIDDDGVAQACRAIERAPGRGGAVKIRIGLSTGTETRTTEDLVALADDIATLGFDSLWMPEILTLPGGDPLVGLAFICGRVPSLKVGTTMLVPGRNLVRLAKQVATLDTLSQGRLLLTLVPGIARGAERRAVGVDPAQRGQILDDALPVLRRLWAGETVSHHGPAGEFEDVTLDPRPVQEPFEVWLGGLVPAALRRCGRLADGWLPALCTPEEAAAGRVVVEESAAQAERAISAEHYGVSVLYVEGDGPDAEALAPPADAVRLRRRRAGARSPLRGARAARTRPVASPSRAIRRGGVLEVRRTFAHRGRRRAGAARAAGSRSGGPADLR